MTCYLESPRGDSNLVLAGPKLSWRELTNRGTESFMESVLRLGTCEVKISKLQIKPNTPFTSSEARRGGLTGVSGQRPEQGAAAKFQRSATWAQGPYPAQ